MLDGLLNLDPAAIAAIVVRTVVVYVALLAGLRLAGKRELGQMTSFDLVVLLVISNAVQNAMVGADTSLTSGLVAATTLLVLNRAVVAVGFRVPWLTQRLAGSPTLLVHNGVAVPLNMRREGVTLDELLQAIREHGLERVEDVKAAVLEVNGDISVVPGADATAGPPGRPRHRRRGYLRRS